jgi:hypothetical protein
MFRTIATSRVFGRRQIGAANPGYSFPARNHRRLDGAIHADRAREALVCRWRRSPATGNLECVWANEPIAAMPFKEDAPAAAFVALPRRLSAVKPSQVQTKMGIRAALHRIAEWLSPWLSGIRAKSPSPLDFHPGAAAPIGWRSNTQGRGLVR